MVFVALLFLAFTVLIEFRSAELSIRQLHYRAKADSTLIEPGEEVVLNSWLYNSGMLPVMYITKIETLPDNARVLESDEWKDIHVSKGSLGNSLKYRAFLWAKRELETKARFTVDKRGLYSYGRYYIEAGDFLGVRTRVKSGDSDNQLVVMPKRTNAYVNWKAYTGFIGDISMPRFIMEDPILTIGYREYTGREPMKSISWNQTAKTGKLMVKQYDHTSEMKATILLNFEDGSEGDLEKCFEVVRTICEDLENKKIAYEFLSNGDVIKKLPNGLGYNHFRQLMKELGMSKCRCCGAFEGIVDKCIENKGASQGYIVVTPRLTDRTQNALKKLQHVVEQKICVLEVAEDED